MKIKIRLIRMIVVLTAMSQQVSWADDSSQTNNDLNREALHAALKKCSDTEMSTATKNRDHMIKKIKVWPYKKA